MRKWIRGVWVAAALAAAACGPAASGGERAPLDVRYVTVKPQDLPVYSDFIGTVTGLEDAEIRARVAGYVTEIHYREGAPVKAGDLLFTIDPVLSQAAVRAAQGDLAIARANLFKAESDIARYEPLVASKAVSQQEYDHAVAAKKLAEAQIAATGGALATAQANLDYTKVKSPLDGIAGVSEVSVGTLVGQGTPTLLTTVSQLDTVRVRFPISERAYIRHAAALQRLTARADEPSASRAEHDRIELILADGSVHPELGWIELVDRAVTASTGTVTLEARFPNPGLLLRPGQFARVRIRTQQLEGALVVPQRAVRERQDLKQIYVLEAGDKVAVRAVQVGQTIGNYWVITAGLQAGDRVLTEGFQKLRPGDVVSATEQPLGDVLAAAPVGSAGAASATPPPAAPPPASAAPSSSGK